MFEQSDDQYNFASLSIKDLLEARDVYHFHLMNKANVVGTAIGRYLIRDKERWPNEHGKAKAVKGKRTLHNSSAREYSWPCVLAFVSSWLPESAFHAKSKTTPPSKIVPKTLYLADGRAVPVCVVAVEPDESDPNERPLSRSWPQHTFGGGMPITVDVQQAQHLASSGCLVSDGNLLYALTARHVCGAPGTPLHGTLRSGIFEVGTSSTKQLTRKAFGEVYPAFSARQSYLNLDVGLIELADANQWTSNVYGLPPIKPIYDLYEQNLSLRLLERHVIAFGAASGQLRGQIKALFYRYRSVGGFDYISDFLIAPEAGTPNSRHGDSGTIWHIDLTADDEAQQKAGVRKGKRQPPKPLLERDLRPIAVQWGGLTFGGPSPTAMRANFALATSLSDVCKLLDVELVTDHNYGASGYWGRTGHYAIARMAIDLIGDSQLKKLLKDNADSLSFDIDAIAKTSFDKSVGTSLAKGEFAHLADVPDDVWKHWPEGHKNGRKGGRDIKGGVHGSDGPEHPNHYADVDVRYGANGELFRSLCISKPDQYLTIAAWKTFYDKFDEQSHEKPKTEFQKGILPFRVWQFFEAMTKFVGAKDVTSYLAAAGVLAHYVGDACQPLHGSQFGQSDSSRDTTTGNRNKDTGKPLKYGDGAHSAYETKMLDHMAPTLFKKINERLPDKHGLPLVKDGRAAALDTLKLMDDVANKLNPMDILDAYEKAGGGTRNDQVDMIWNTKTIGERTADVMTLGVRHLAMIWEAAWKAGGDSAIAASKINKIEQDALRRCYENVKFIPSLTIETIATALSPQARGSNAAAGGTPATASTGKLTRRKTTARKALPPKTLPPKTSARRSGSKTVSRPRPRPARTTRTAPGRARAPAGRGGGRRGR